VENSKAKIKLQITKDFLRDIRNLTEERDFQKNVTQALTQYYSILQYQAAQHKLAMLPVTERGEFDFERPIIFIDEE
jgi:3-methyladenine DNA glycosylase AlkD